MRVEERVQAAVQFKPEVASLNMGSINLGLYGTLACNREFKRDWEPEFLESIKDLVFPNSFKDIEFILTTCYDNDTRFEFEGYDIAHLYKPQAFPRPRLGEAALVHAIGLRHPGGASAPTPRT